MSDILLDMSSKFPSVKHFQIFTSDFAPRAVEVAIKELTAVANPGEVDQVQLYRAKQSTKSAILMNLESRMVASEDIGRQLLTYGERKPVEHFLKAIDAISANDIASVAQKLTSSPLTMASYGDDEGLKLNVERIEAASYQNSLVSNSV
ncbi:hypothetical protein K7X08_000822 [Anisodus acutangulus]|uniref:Uncharacterized protein n=1 Tax=Anisodus acutangulus TaxID=402998 RepID=A0A9Q1MMI7_9SOLA|nr:hypothetical protein K7X08_000822 [Anisodus acutangulus]